MRTLTIALALAACSIELAANETVVAWTSGPRDRSTIGVRVVQ